MCGIAGVLNFKDKNQAVELVERMLARIHHRGPDESGMLVSDQAIIGNVRLSIIDIASGQQPMWDSTGRYWIVFNGEIFNYIELKQELEKKGIKFKTNCDTEVFLQAFIFYGKECLQKFNGQFAVAIWDNEEKELFLARDRMGIRPLFYCKKDKFLIFGSEIKAILESKEITPEISAVSLSQILTFWTTLTPRTAFKGIYELPPGHYMSIKKNNLSINQYYSLSFAHPDNYRYTSLSGAIDKFDELLKDSLRLRLRADVKVAAYLSGGIDSSATTAYIKEIEPDVLNTFSIGFSENEFDESSHQKQAAAHFNTDHHSVTCTNQDIANFFPTVIWHAETPLTRTGPAPMYLLSKLVRENNIKVVITGEGADEMMAGYNIFKEAEIRGFWAREPNSRFRPLLLKKLYPYIPGIAGGNALMLKLFFGYQLQSTNNPLYSHLLRWNNAKHIKKHFSEDYLYTLENYDPINDLANNPKLKSFDKMENLSKAQWLESSLFLSGYLLSSQGDRMTMANSVEGRYPFLDYRLIEFFNSLPPKFKLNGLNEKYILKKLVRGKVPESIINRPKQAYRAPIRNAFFGSDSLPYVKELTSKDFIDKAGIFSSKSLTSFFEKIKNNPVASEMENMIIMSVISTHLLYYQFVLGNKPEFVKKIKPVIITTNT
jgi:asparagine synthase (glutamine-hydrolysing)